MTETRRRIKAYQEALPALRERVVAVALLMVMSMAMMVSASFAWVTLSIAPELSNVSTTVTSNGNLEIALAKKDGTAPDESAVGDSGSVRGQSVTEANLTWGNLVNLSDPSYGLDHLVLRPALLGNSSQLLEKPLKGVDYGADGRAELYYNENYAYTSWVVPDASLGVDPYFGYFGTPQYGVRAISTTKVTYQNLGYRRFTELYGLATSTHDTVRDQYDAMFAKENGKNNKYILALADLIGVFMTDKLNEKDSDISNDTLESVYLLMKEFESVMINFQEPMMHLANAQIYNSLGNDALEYYEQNAFKNVDEFLEAYRAGELSASMDKVVDEYFRIKADIDYALYGKDVVTDGETVHENGVADFYAQIKANSSNKVKMSSLNSIVMKLVNINTCQIICEGNTYTVGNLGMSAATKLLGKDVDAVIKGGALKDFEQLTGYTMCATNVEVKATYIVTVTMKAKTITTGATEPYLIVKEQLATKAAQDSNMGTATITAEDTYGMALDFWVRTNADDAYLILEGNVLTTSSMVRATGFDIEGNSVDLYTVTITIPEDPNIEGDEDMVQEVAVYYDSEDKLRDADTHSLIYLYDDEGNQIPDDNISSPIERFAEVVEVTGYEGENRVWQDNELLDINSTTQGSGSCYVFYSDDPAQQLSSLKLLSNLRIAFVDGTEDSATYGKKVAVACLDTENYYGADGKFIVPLKLYNDGSAFLTSQYNGDMAILQLERNKAIRLTAIIYLDGQSISNAEVLAANDIQGRLNIQFGSSVEMEAIENEELAIQTRSIIAQAKKSSDATYVPNGTPIEFSFDQMTESNPMKVDVAVTVDGDAPATVTAFFMRRVNETQGSREDQFELKLDPATGMYVGSYTFDAPGNYVLRTVQLDGMDYDLPVTSYPQVKISGFNINTVTCDLAMVERAATIMTGDRSVTTDLSLRFSTDQKVPNSVLLQFEGSDGTLTTANMTLDSSTQSWSGSATFTSSGEYTLRYVVMNGEYDELDEKFQRTLTIYLGMSVRVRDTGEFNNMLFKGESQTVPVYVDIYDNLNEKLRNQPDVQLRYDRAGSILDGMDPSLKWNASEDCYVGNLQIAQPGYYTFNSVSVGNSRLTVTREAPPTYTFTNPEPPVYEGIKMPASDYIIAKGAAEENIVVSMTNAESALMRIEVYDADTNTRMYLGGIGKNEKNESVAQEWQTMTSNVTANEFAFSLMDLTTGELRLGDWTVTKIELANVFAKVGETLVEYTKEKPMVFSYEQTESTTDTQITADDTHVQIVNVKVVASGSGEEVSGKKFLEAGTTTSGVTVQIMDHMSRPLNVTVKDAVVRYQHIESTTSDYGGYKVTLPDDGEGIIDSYTLTGSGKNFTSPKLKLTYAGEYKPYDLIFYVDNGTEKGLEYSWNLTKGALNDGLNSIALPTFKLRTESPTVKVTGTDPKPGTIKRVYTVKTPTNTDQAIEGNFFSYSDYYATVYIHTPAQGGGYDQEAAEAYAPKVTLALSEVPAGYSTASMVFVTTNADSNSSTFTFTNGTATAEVGKAVTGQRGWFGVDEYPKCYPAGTMTQDSISITYGSLTYDVTLSNPITIDQPQSPTVLKFTGIPESYTGTKPAQVQGVGTMVTVTLPELTWTARIEEPKDGTWSAYTAVGEVTDSNGDPVGRVYGHRYWTTKNSCGGTDEHNQYQYYIWTKFQSSITAQTDIFTQAMKITRWIINGTTYNAGETVTVTGNGIISAAAVISDAGEKTFVETLEQTTVKNQYGYVKETNLRESLNGGTILGETMNGQNATLPAAAVANPSTANASTDKVGTNMTTDSAEYDQFWP